MQSSWPLLLLCVAAFGPFAPSCQAVEKSLAPVSPIPANARIDKQPLIEALEACPLVTEQLGDAIHVVWTRSIGSAGIWWPPVAQCTHKAYVKGSLDGAELYFSTQEAGACFHLSKHAGRMRQVSKGQSQAIYIITDVRACSQVEQ